MSDTPNEVRDSEHPNTRLGRSVLEDLIRFLNDPITVAPTQDPMADLEEFGCWLANKYVTE